MSSTEAPATGACPACGTALAPRNVLIEYERDGKPTSFAECPGCGGVVRPT